MKFQVGDRVRVVNKDSRMFGEICTVTSELVFCGWPVPDERYPDAYCHRVDIPSKRTECGWFYYRPEDLQLIDDGNEVISWEDCIWQPKVENA